jgi:transcriptional regulator with XRE-family HTH domain
MTGGLIQMNAESSELGTFLRAAREGSQLTLRAVEKATGISNAYLSQLESGKIRQPSPVVLHKLSELYETSYAYAMELAGYPVPDSSDTNESYTRLASRFGPISREEEESLAEYLEFLRARRRG